MKRFLAWSLSLTMLIGLSGTAWAAGDISGVFYDTGETITEAPTWSLDEGTLTVSGSCEMSSYTDEEPAPWRENAADIRRVVIGDGITAIGSKAFQTLKNLEEVTIADSVEVIGGEAFNSCEALRSVSLGQGLRELGEGAFGHCFALTEITIPAGVCRIGPQVFAGCTALTLRVAEGNEDYCCVDNVLFSKDMSRLVFCSNQKVGSYTVPDSVTVIENSAFYYCTGLHSITIPDSVTEIGDDAFNQCGLREMTLPAGLTRIGENLFWSNFDLTRVTIPEGVVSIGSYAFTNCDRLSDLRLPGGLETIGEYAFSGCAVLTVLYYGGSDEQWTQWLAIYSQDGWHPLADAQVITGFAVGNLNGQGEEPDAADVQCLYEYLTTGEMTGRYKESPMAFEAAANVNGVGGVDVYDLQRLYERAAKIA